MSNKTPIPISFEVFPPKTLSGFYKLNETCLQLRQLDPQFTSVTFGAIGASQAKTLLAVRKLVQNGSEVAPHISCVNMTALRLEKLLARYIQWGIKRLVVIRGDIVVDKANAATEFKYACELVSYIRKLTGNHFHIAVAAYPEFHPEATNIQQDLIHFQRKVAAGANSAITQFFYNADAYVRFVESCRQLGITIPIIPGIMPIMDYARLMRISASCGAEIPLWLGKRLQAHADDPVAVRALGIEIVTKLCERLLMEGAPALHFYTLNQLEPIKIIQANLGVCRYVME